MEKCLPVIWMVGHKVEGMSDGYFLPRIHMFGKYKEMH